jgi:hypothetical protein
VNRVQRWLLTAAILIATGAAKGQNVDLDAPVVRAPTIRSEIRRGHADAFDCFINATDNTDAGEFMVCLNQKIEEDGRYATSSNAYLFGAYSQGLHILKTIMTTPGNAKLRKDTGKLAVEAQKQWELDLKNVLASSHLTKKNLCEAIVATDLAKCESEFFFF